LRRPAGRSEVARILERGQQVAGDDAPPADRLRDQPHPVAVLARRPRGQAGSVRAGDHLGAVGGGDLLGEPAHQHAPAGAGALIDLVDLEGDVGVVGGGELGAGRHPHHDDLAVQGVVDREDQRVVLGVDAEPADLLRGEQPVALVSGEDLHLGGLALAVGGHAPTLAPGGGPVIPPEGRAGTDGSPGRARANGPRWRGRRALPAVSAGAPRWGRTSGGSPMSTDVGRRTVTVGVDGSDHALRAGRWGAAEAGRRGAPRRVVTAFGWPGERPGGFRLDYHQMLRGRAEAQLAQARAEALRVAPCTEVEAEVVVGSPRAVLGAEARSAEVLVVGSRGFGRVEGLFAGSVGVALAAGGPCPVVVVRGEERDPGEEQRLPVVVGVDGATWSEEAIAFAFDAAASRGVEL